MKSTQIKGLVAGFATVAAVGLAVAQSNPPNPAAANPAMGAGQQSSQGTPMGTTGTPAGGGMTMNSSSTDTSASSSNATTMGAGTDTGTTAPVQADRN